MEVAIVTPIARPLTMNADEDGGVDLGVVLDEATRAAIAVA
jgi:hypothetical protein